MTVTAVSHTANNPKHDITLSDGSTVVGIVVTDANGEKNPRGIQEYPQQRMALKTAQGGGKYDDLELPYMSIVQDDWSGGRGNRVFEDDKSKFYHSVSVDTTKEGAAILASQEVHCPRATGYSNAPAAGSVTYTMVNFDSSYPYLATSFAPDNTFTPGRVQLWLDIASEPTTSPEFTITLCADSTGSPNMASTFGTGTITLAVTSKLNGIEIDLTGAVQLVSGTTYWFVIRNTNTVSPYILGGTSAAGTGKKSLDGTTWTSGTEFFFRVLPNPVEFSPIFFQYKSAQYMVKRFDSGANSTLWLNGDRGAVSSYVTGSTLIDASKTWTVDEWIGSIVLLVGGPGSEEDQPWRTIYDSDGTTLTVIPAWNVTHTTSTEYVILKSNKWTSVQDLGDDVTDVAVCNEIVYFARGADVDSLRYQEINLGGTWTRRTAADAFRGYHMQFVQRAERAVLYAANISDSYLVKDVVREQDIPSQWGTVTSTPDSLGMWKKRKLVDTNLPWSSRVVTNVTTTKDTNGDMKIAVAAGFTTGIVAVQDIEPQSISDCNCIGFYMMSDVTTSGSNDLYLVLDDAQDLGRAFGASGVFYYDGTTYTDLAKSRDGLTSIASSATIAAGYGIYVVASEPFNKVTFVLGATINNNAATLSGNYYNGSVFTSMTITDGTAVGGAPFGDDNSTTSITFTIPADWEQFTVNGVTGYVALFTSSALLDAVDFYEIYCQRTNNTEIAIPDLTANRWQWVKLNYVPNADTAPKEHMISSVGIKVATDLGAQNIYIAGNGPMSGIWLGENDRETVIPDSTNITGLAPYAADGSGIPNLWVFTSRYIYEMQIDNNNAIVQVPIGEIEHMGDHRNGRFWCISDVYLYFNLKDKVERYYNRNLDDIGPDRDEGLWAESLNGNISGLLAYPGAVYASVNAASGKYHSGIYVYKNSGWHNIHRGKRTTGTGLPIRGIAHQSIPGTLTGRLWFTEEDDILYLNTHPNPYSADDYYYTWKGYLETSWIYTSMAEIVKVWKNLKLVMYNAAAFAQMVKVDYADDNSATYTTVGTYDTEPSEEISIATTPPTGRNIRFMLRFYTTSSTLTPYLEALILECFGVVPTKYAWAFNTVLKEDYLMFNLQEEPEQALGIQDRAENAYSQLKTWANAATVLTMRSRYSVYDNKTVVINPPASNPLRIASEEQHEDILVNITLLEL